MFGIVNAWRRGHLAVGQCGHLTLLLVGTWSLGQLHMSTSRQIGTWTIGQVDDVTIRQVDMENNDVGVGVGLGTGIRRWRRCGRVFMLFGSLL